MASDRELKLKLVMALAEKVTKPLKQISEGSGKTAEAIKASRDELKHLERVQKDMRSFRNLKRQSENSAQAMEDQQKEIKELTRQIEQAEGPTKALTRTRNASIKQARKLKEQYESEQQQLQQLRSTMTRVDGVTGSFSDQQSELTRRIRTTNDQLEAQQRQLSETARHQRKAADAAKRYQRAADQGGRLTGAGAAAAAGGGVALAVMTGQAFTSEIGGARLAAQFGEGPEAAERYENVISNAYAGGRGAGLDQVIAGVSAIGSAFGTLETLSSAKMQAITNQALTLSDVFGIDFTEAVQTAKIMVTNGLAKNATAAFDLIGRSFQEVPATMRGELMEILHEYSTNFRALGFSGKEGLNMLVAAAQQGKFALDKTGDALKEFTIRGSDMSKASVEAYEAIGLNAKQMANAIASGGDQAHKALLVTSRSLLDVQDPAKRANAAIALFGTPIEDLSVDQIPKFLKALAGTEDRLGNVVGATKEMGKTLDNNAGSALKNIQRALSGAFMDVLDSVEDEIIAVSKAVTGWIKENPELVNTLAKAAAAIAAVVAVGGTLTAVLGAIIGPIAMVNIALAFLAANPVVLTIMAIVAAAAALAGAAYLIYKNWGSISAWFGDRWQDIKGAFSGGLGSVMKLLLNWNPIGLIYKGIVAGLEKLGIDVLAKFSTLGNAIIDGLIGGLVSANNVIRDAILGLGNSIIGWFKDTLGINSPSKIFAGFGANLLAGLISGIDEKWQMLKDKISSVAGGVMSWFKDKLGINSPSRVFMGFGVNTLEGYQKGLAAKESGPLRQIGAFSQRMKRAGAGLAIGAASLPALADIPLDTRPPISAASSGGLVMGDINITVNPSPGMDEQALARYVAAEVQRALAQAKHEAGVQRRSALYDTD